VRSTRRRLSEELTEIAAERERTLREGEEAEERKVEIEAELRSLADRIQDLHGVRSDRAEVVAGRERDKSEVSAAEQQDSETIREARRRASEARHGAHEAEMKLTQLRNDLKHLEERLCEDYELDPAALNAYEPGEVPEGAPRVLAELRERMRKIGPVNLLAMEEYEEKSERFTFMSTQRDDLVKAKDVLERTILEINKKASGMFLDTFTLVQENFQKTFGVLFQGGECSLALVGDDPLEAEIDVVARPRGKRPQGIHQLSSGERALTAIALLFAIYLVKPSPFCILDEVDAPLDDANIDRFIAMITEFSKRTQFIMITHNKKTMEAANCLYGVTMQSPGVSSVVSVRLDGQEGRELLEKVDLSVRETAPVGAVVDAGNGHHEPGEEDEPPVSPEGAIVQ
jgi:chromosome segregation protein